jgi:hypothetical protein
MTRKKAIQLVVIPRSNADGGSVLFVLFDDGEVRQIQHDGIEWRWSTTGPASCCDERCPRCACCNEQREQHWHDAEHHDHARHPIARRSSALRRLMGRR